MYYIKILKYINRIGEFLPKKCLIHAEQIIFKHRTNEHILMCKKFHNILKVIGL